MDLETRIATLERSRVRMQGTISALVLVICAAAVMAQTSSTQTLTAREILIVDKTGRVTAKITGGSMFGDMAGLDITDPKDQHMLTLTRLGDNTSFTINPPVDLSNKARKGFGGFALMTSPTLTTVKVFEGESNVELIASDSVAELAVAGHSTSHLRVAALPPDLPPLPSDATPQQWANRLKEAVGRSNADRKTALDLSADADNATLTISDEQGFETQVGNSRLQTPRTGATSRTSAASLLLFDGDKRVLWRVPQ